MPRPISREELRRRIGAGDVILVEALSEARFEAEGHLPTAICIDLPDVAAKAPQLLPDREALIVTYCTSTRCPNSAIAARQLESLGYSQVFEYVEGKADWREAGLPLEHADVTV